MGSVLIVEVHEPAVADVASGFTGPVADVGPFLKQDAVEALDLAVGLGSVGASPAVGDRVARASCSRKTARARNAAALHAVVQR